MKIKIDENVRKIASGVNQSKEAVAHTIADALLSIYDVTPDDYGQMLIEVLDDADIEAVVSAVLNNGENACKDAEYLCEYVGKIVILGDGPCPHCGGELELSDTEGHSLGDGDSNTPDGWSVDNYVYVCRVCGETFKSEKQL